MKKLTSKDIEWIDGMNFAIVHIARDAPYSQFESLSMLSPHFTEEYHYLVYREPIHNQEIVDAVNELEGVLTIENCYMYDHDEMLNKNRGGSYVATSAKLGDDLFICTISEFNQYVKEMSEAAWLNNGEPQYYHIHKKAVVDIEAVKEVEWKNGDECVCNGVTHQVRYYVGTNPKSKTMCVVVDEQGYTDSYYISDLSKPETEQQKAKRELEEKAEKIYGILHAESDWPVVVWSFLAKEEKCQYVALARKVTINE